MKQELVAESSSMTTVPLVSLEDMKPLAQAQSNNNVLSPTAPSTAAPSTTAPSTTAPTTTAPSTTVPTFNLASSSVDVPPTSIFYINPKRTRNLFEWAESSSRHDSLRSVSDNSDPSSSPIVSPLSNYSNAKFKDSPSNLPRIESISINSTPQLRDVHQTHHLIDIDEDLIHRQRRSAESTLSIGGVPAKVSFDLHLERESRPKQPHVQRRRRPRSPSDPSRLFKRKVRLSEESASSSSPELSPATAVAQTLVNLSALKKAASEYEDLLNRKRVYKPTERADKLSPPRLRETVRDLVHQAATSFSTAPVPVPLPQYSSSSPTPSTSSPVPAPAAAPAVHTPPMMPPSTSSIPASAPVMSQGNNVIYRMQQMQQMPYLVYPQQHQLPQQMSVVPQPLMAPNNYAPMQLMYSSNGGMTYVQNSTGMMNTYQPPAPSMDYRMGPEPPMQAPQYVQHYGSVPSELMLPNISGYPYAPQPTMYAQPQYMHAPSQGQPIVIYQTPASGPVQGSIPGPIGTGQ